MSVAYIQSTTDPFYLILTEIMNLWSWYHSVLKKLQSRFLELKKTLLPWTTLFYYLPTIITILSIPSSWFLGLTLVFTAFLNHCLFMCPLCSYWHIFETNICFPSMLVHSPLGYVNVLTVHYPDLLLNPHSLSLIISILLKSIFHF